MEKHFFQQVKKGLNKPLKKVIKVGPVTRAWGLATRLKYRTKIKNKKGR